MYFLDMLVMFVVCNFIFWQLLSSGLCSAYTSFYHLFVFYEVTKTITSASVELTQTRHSHSKQLFHGGQISVFLQGGSKSFIRCLWASIFSGRWDISDVKARNGQKFEFLANPVETPWPMWMALCQNVRRSLPYIFDRTSRRWKETGTIAGWSTIGEIKKTGFASLIFGPPCRTTWPMGQTHATVG